MNDYTYLIQQNEYYKIGYSTNIKSRMLAYETHAPNFTLLGCIPGNCEKELHNKFKKYHYKKEWYNKNQDILDEFNKNGIKDFENLIEKDSVSQSPKTYINNTRICVDVDTAILLYNHNYDELCDLFLKITCGKNGEKDKMKGFPLKDNYCEDLKECRNSTLEKLCNKNNDADYYIGIPTIGDVIQWMIDKYHVFIEISYIKVDGNFCFKYCLIDLKTGLPYKGLNYNIALNEYSFSVCKAIHDFFNVNKRNK